MLYTIFISLKQKKKKIQIMSHVHNRWRVDGRNCCFSSYNCVGMLQMAEIAEWCLSENAIDRPEIRDIVVTLSQIMMSSVEWEAGNSQVFSGLFNGR
jgi:hypothetical protein